MFNFNARANTVDLVCLLKYVTFCRKNLDSALWAKENGKFALWVDIYCTAPSSLVHMIRHICICLCIWYMIWRGRYTWQTQSQVVVNLMSISWAWQTDDKMIGHNENQEARRCLKIAFKYFHIYQVQIWSGHQLNEFNIHWGKILRAWIFPRIPLFLCSFLCHVFYTTWPTLLFDVSSKPKGPKVGPKSRLNSPLYF